MTRKAFLVSIACGAAFLWVACPAKDESTAVRSAVVQYWGYIYQGATRSAYDMLDSESRNRITYRKYAEKVGFGTSNIPEIKEYWKAYQTMTNIEIKNVAVQGGRANADLVLTIPDPKWFPDEAYAESQRLGLKDQEYALFMIKAQTQALKEGRIPLVRLMETTNLVKEGEAWKIVFVDEG
ncbi:hypothetical protein GX441_10485 [bacterium]|nr:hypothetical protein [bacterium]